MSSASLWWTLGGPDGHTPVPGSRPPGQIPQIARTQIGAILVSTVFLCIDHGWNQADPVLFETMVFNGPLDGTSDRYTTWDAAMAGHQALVALLICHPDVEVPRDPIVTHLQGDSPS